jgi:exopolyphosphatase/guanosine-5'-triphosphate,3'-diphosphate pyrophosphatase
MSRYSVDGAQVERVKQTALLAFDKIAEGMFLRPVHRQLLGWAADLHEAGLSVSHSQYHLHSGYLVEHSDMSGFTRQEQMFVAALVRNHRRAIPRGFTDKLPTRLHEPLRLTLLCLRLACVLSRSRDDEALPRFRLSGSDNMISVSFSESWKEAHPLTLFDLRQETRDLASIGLVLRVTDS